MSGHVAMRQVSVERLFAENRDRLGLDWLAGRQGGNRMLTAEASLKPTVGLVGHMNFIHPFRIQLLGAAEAAYLRGLSAAELERSIDRLFTTDLAAIIVANGEDVPAHLEDNCTKHHVALFVSPYAFEMKQRKALPLSLNPTGFRVGASWQCFGGAWTVQGSAGKL